MGGPVILVLVWPQLQKHLFPFNDLPCERSPYGLSMAKMSSTKYMQTYWVSGIYLGRAIAILALIFRKWRREKTVWGQFVA